MSMPIAATAQSLKGEAAGIGGSRRAWRGLLRVLSGHHAIAAADQAVVSAASFLAVVLIGRWTDASQLGIYAIGGSVLALLLATQESLVTRPYAIELHRPLGAPADHAFSALTCSFLLAGAAMAALGAVALALHAFGASGEVVLFAAILAGTAPFVLIREFARRFAFAHLRMPHALMLDAAVAALNILVLGWLGLTGRLSAFTAFAAVGVACAVCTAGWLYLARANFAFHLGHFRDTVKRSWGVGKWLLSGQLALQAQGYMTHWLSLVTAGAAVTGVYTACMSIVSFANPLLFGFFNILTPRSVRALQSGGGAGLRRQAARDALLLAVIMAAFSATVLVVGEDVLHFLFPAMQQEGNGRILSALTLAALASAVGVPASIALASAGHARAVAGVMAATSALNVVLVWTFMTQWGLLGAAYGILAAEIAGSLGRWVAFLALVPNSAAALQSQAGSPTQPDIANAAAETSS